MSLPTQPYKGARDFYPSEKRVQNYMFNTVRDVVKSFGYEEYDAPILEPLDLYRAKTGDEIVNEQVYSFVDRGNREVAIRPEMTPTVSRMVAGKRQELAYPLRWFSIPNLWRYERPQRGRLREHWQLNVDIFGEAGLPADHEIVIVADAILKKFGATSGMYEIRINSREHMNKVLDGLNVAVGKRAKIVNLIDKRDKLDTEVFEKSLSEFTDQTSELLMALDSDDTPEYVEDLIDLLNSCGIDNVVFKPSLARGFEYYTDIVFEVFDTSPDNNRSMFGGGRYDGLVGLFGVEPVPTVGFGMGDVTLRNFLETNNLLPELPTEIDAVAVLVGDVYAEAQKSIDYLRKQGLNISVDATDRKIANKLNHAEKSGVQHVLFIGKDELESGQFGYKSFMASNEGKAGLEELSFILGKS